MDSKNIKAQIFVKGKRNTGFFALMDIFNNTVATSVNVKKNCQRLTARSTTIIQETAIPPLSPFGDLGVSLPKFL